MSELNNGKGIGVRRLMGVLVVVVLVELLLYRIVPSLGFDIEPTGQGGAVFGVLTTVGSFVLDVASVVAMLGVFVAGTTLFRGRPMGFLLLLYGALALVVAFVGPSLGATFSVATLAALVAIVLSALIRAEKGFCWRVALVLFLAGYLCVLFYRLAPTLLAGTVLEGLVSAAGALGLGEALVLLATIPAYLAWGFPGVIKDRGAMYLALAIATAFGLAFVVLGYTSATVTTWTLGLTLFLPLPFYVLGLFLYSLAVLVSLRGALSFERGMGLVLLAAAGLSLESTYLQALAVLGMALVSTAQTNAAISNPAMQSNEPLEPALHA